MKKIFKNSRSAMGLPGVWRGSTRVLQKLRGSHGSSPRALQGYSAVGHCRDTWWLGRDTLRLGTARILGGSALQGYLAVRRCRDALRLGTAKILCGGALHEYSRQRARTTLTLKSNNPTVRVGNNIPYLYGRI